MNENICEWIRAFDMHFDISCANETGETAWEFIYCPYCGKIIKILESKYD